MKRGMYQHYKGKYYQVFNVVLHTETHEKMVLYRALYDCPELTEEFGTAPFFVRPFDMFNKTVNLNGVETPCFKFIGPIE